jgi:hypothetical protein
VQDGQGRGSAVRLLDQAAERHLPGDVARERALRPTHAGADPEAVVIVRDLHPADRPRAGARRRRGKERRQLGCERRVAAAQLDGAGARGQHPALPFNRERPAIVLNPVGREGIHRRQQAGCRPGSDRCCRVRPGPRPRHGVAPGQQLTRKLQGAVLVPSSPQVGAGVVQNHEAARPRSDDRQALLDGDRGERSGRRLHRSGFALRWPRTPNPAPSTKGVGLEQYGLKARAIRPPQVLCRWPAGRSASASRGDSLRQFPTRSPVRAQASPDPRNYRPFCFPTCLLSDPISRRRIFQWEFIYQKVEDM